MSTFKREEFSKLINTIKDKTDSFRTVKKSERLLILAEIKGMEIVFQSLNNGDELFYKLNLIIECLSEQDYYTASEYAKELYMDKERYFNSIGGK